MSEPQPAGDKRLNEDLNDDLNEDLNHDLRLRACKECGVAYTIDVFHRSCAKHFDCPDRYSEGCGDYCLACWLGVGPNDFPPDDRPWPDDMPSTAAPGKRYSPSRPLPRPPFAMTLAD